MKKKVIIIGSGFAGMSAACFLAKAGYSVTVLEKHDTPGGRARQLKADGFTFDMGPSWYWMPDVFENFFNAFGKKVSDYYKLHRLDPSYRVYWEKDYWDVPADYESLKSLFEKIEPGSGQKLDNFLKEAAYKYRVGIDKLVHKPGQSMIEFIDADLINGIFRLDVFQSMKAHVAKYFDHPLIRQLLEFPVLFLGALPEKIPALYSLMNYADIKGGTWYPEGGMFSIVKAMHSLAVELGVQFFFKHDVQEIIIEKKAAKKIIAKHGSEVYSFRADIIIGGADYHFIENSLLPEEYRSYTEAYWNKRVMAPGCLIYYIGLNTKLKNILHHSLFFDADFNQHGKEIYETKHWPKDPLFYVSVTSVSDPTVAPNDCENLFILIPVAAGLDDDTESIREYYFDKVVKRIEERIGQNISDHIIYKKTYAHSDFVNDYNAFKGNAYGLANTLMQTAILKPSCRSKKVKNLFYTGQLTVPGPGVPPSLISGEVVAKEVLKYFK